ncbi:phospholipase A2 A2-actitoxin-Cgg2a-like [Branchiostoma floridae x Branchiostoma belcheri]
MVRLLPLLCLVTFALCGHVVAMPKAVTQLGVMISKVTGRPPWKYWNYGCWCGKGGQGPAVDATDSCCRTHDFCYDALEQPPCRWTVKQYLTAYKYSIDGKTVTCGDQEGTCKRTLCECDKTVVNCFARSQYVEAHDHMDQTICKKGNSTEVMHDGLSWTFP